MTKRSPHYSASFERDWDFYLSSVGVFGFCGKHDNDLIQKTNSHLDGYSAKEAFAALDSRGKIIPCSETQLLLEVLRTKASVNWQIKQWAEMLVAGLLFPEELVECKKEFGLPGWAIDAVLNQAKKLGWPVPWIEYTRSVVVLQERTNNDL
jgi:hypothetical protein